MKKKFKAIGILLVIFLIWFIIWFVHGTIRKRAFYKICSWETHASGIKPVTFNEAIESNKKLIKLPKDATNIYHYQTNFSFFKFVYLLRFKAPKESLLEYVDEVIKTYPESKEFWNKTEITPEKVGIIGINDVTWFDIENIQNGVMWKNFNLSDDHEESTIFHQIFIDFDRNILYEQGSK